MAEIATSVYFDQKNIRHVANILSHTEAFNIGTYAEADFIINWNGSKRIVEVKSNQLHHNTRFFRMLTP